MLLSKVNRNMAFLIQPLKIISTVTLHRHVQLLRNKFFQPIPNKGYTRTDPRIDMLRIRPPLKQYIPMS